MYLCIFFQLLVHPTRFVVYLVFLFLWFWYPRLSNLLALDSRLRDHLRPLACADKWETSPISEVRWQKVTQFLGQWRIFRWLLNSRSREFESPVDSPNRMTTNTNCLSVGVDEKKSKSLSRCPGWDQVVRMRTWPTNVLDSGVKTFALKWRPGKRPWSRLAGRSESGLVRIPHLCGLCVCVFVKLIQHSGRSRTIKTERKS